MISYTWRSWRLVLFLRVVEVESRGRLVPAKVRRTVAKRDGGRCTYVDPVTGRRCRETRMLELHHEHTHALGGRATAKNLTLRCRAHNRLAAEQDFGRDFMAEKIGQRDPHWRGGASQDNGERRAGAGEGDGDATPAGAGTIAGERRAGPGEGDGDGDPGLARVVVTMSAALARVTVTTRWRGRCWRRPALAALAGSRLRVARGSQRIELR